jgi:Raf kinase inhibitor-like YbhB/YbcL family protein
MAAVAAVTLASCGGSKAGKSPSPATPAPASTPATITLKSPAFAPNGTIPTLYTCAGAGSQPPLVWSGVPRRAASLTLLVTDPDAPSGPFVHWAVSGIPATARSLLPNALPAGARESSNSTRSHGWTPPCPPRGGGRHHYVFTLTARTASGVPIAVGRLVGRFGR